MVLWQSLLLSLAAGVSSVAIIGAFLARFLTGRITAVVVPVVAKKVEDLSTTIDARFDHNDRATEACNDAIAGVREEQVEVKLDLARQFGGNGNGLRQAINEMNGNFAKLSGAFEQHVREASK